MSKARERRYRMAVAHQQVAREKKLCGRALRMILIGIGAS